MKKILLLIVCGSFVCEANAQKAGNYTPFVGPYNGWTRSTEFAVCVVGDSGCIWSASNNYATTFPLFPDSLAIMHVADINNPNSSHNSEYLAAMGFTFDPYSMAFNGDRTRRLFLSSIDSLCGYRIDDLILYGDYRIADYNPNSPDTLRIFITSHNAYNYPDSSVSDTMVGIEYFKFEWVYDHASFVTPIIKYDDVDNISQKGSVTKPAAKTLRTIDYILTPNDSTGNWVPGSVYAKPIMIDNIDYQVPVGSVVSIMMKFIPGYDYNNGDTIQKTYYSSSLNTVTGLDIRKNIFAVSVIDEDTIYNSDWFNDYGRGYNTRLAESMAVRYNIDSLYKDDNYNPLGLSAYTVNFLAYPYALLGFSISDDIWDLLAIPAVKEINAIVSKIYPNPANDQIKIELTNSEVVELRILNILGQVVKVATLNEMNNTVDVSSLNSGMYILKASQGGSVFITKMIKK